MQNVWLEFHWYANELHLFYDQVSLLCKFHFYANELPRANFIEGLNSSPIGFFNFFKFKKIQIHWHLRNSRNVATLC